jgi:GGDEF domain-containing protein
MSDFEDVLKKEFARATRYREPLAILLLEVDPAGEALGTIRDGVRLCDSVIPDGGRRVAVVLPETELQGALGVATRLGRVLSPPEASPAVAPPAIGIGIFPSPQATDALALIRSAELALEQARTSDGGVAFR